MNTIIVLAIATVVVFFLLMLLLLFIEMALLDYVIYDFIKNDLN
jgi:hypothetical protein